MCHYCAVHVLSNQGCNNVEICKKGVHVIANTELMHCLYFPIIGLNMFAPDGGSLYSHGVNHTGPSQFLIMYIRK